MRAVTVSCVAGLILVLTGVFRPAEARPDRWDLSRYQAPAFRDSLAHELEGPGMVLLDRDWVRLQKKGERVVGAVENEWLLLVGEPTRLESYRRMTFEEYPGRKIEKIEACHITRDGIERIKAEERTPLECRPYQDHKQWTIDFGEMQSGDILAVRSEYVLEGDNPVFAHAFERELPVRQTDVTIEVPTELFEEKYSAGWHWWAGSWPRNVANQAWERPTTWRFRWGERNLELADGTRKPRSVMSAWTYDPVAVRQGVMIGSSGRAVGGVDPSYHGPVLSAQVLSGLTAASRQYGDDVAEEDGKLSEASFGSLDWEVVAERYADEHLKKRIGDCRPLDGVVKSLTDGAKSDLERVERLAADVAERIETVPAPLRTTLYDLHRPVDVFRQRCATTIDKAILLCAMIHRAGMTVHPVLVLEEDFVQPQVSLEVFEKVWVLVSSASGRLLVNPEDGRVIVGKVPEGWAAAITLPACGDGTAKLCYREESLMELLN